jgi:hypothetical protein
MSTGSGRPLSQPRLLWCWLVCSLVALMTGCQSTPARLPADLDAHVELADVPFFPQADYQCGPAALATVLQHAGVEITPDALVPMVYLPERHGSLQTELSAATRRFDRVPYALPGNLRSVVREVQAGRPVLILQNLGLRHWPQWHFAVVVGFDRDSQRMVLRSGTERRAVMSVGRFARTWERGGSWSMVALRTHELPAEPEPERYMTAAAGLEAIGRLDAASEAYATARATWPSSAWPVLGLANIAYLRERYELAESLYREVIELDPAQLTARYNLADTLVQRGCNTAARAELQQALSLAGDSPMKPRLQALFDELGAATSADRDVCHCKGPGC